MARFCITAANHTNPSNHVSSTFNVWAFSKNTEKWVPLGGQSISFILTLLANGNAVFSAKENDTTITLGAPLEIELRTSKNNEDYKISTMPSF